MSEIIPNTFQTPNAHVDRAMMYLTGDEYKVLNYAVRHIYGWQDSITERCGAISISKFANGYTTSKGKKFGGVGLGRPTVIHILGDLVRFGLLVKVGEVTAKGQAWSIGESPDWAALEQRYAEKKLSARERTAKATEAKRLAGTSDDTSNVSRTSAGSSDDTTAGTSDDTQINTLLNPSSNPSIVPDGTDGDSKSPKKRKKKAEPKPRKEVEPEPLYEAVELHIFGIAPDENAPYDWNGRCGVIARWLNGQVSRFRDHEFGRISSPAQPEHVKRFADDYRQNNERASLPKDPVKFVENWRKWASSLKSAAPKPVARTAPTPEEQAAAKQRVELMRERLAATLAQDNPT